MSPNNNLQSTTSTNNEANTPQGKTVIELHLKTSPGPTIITPVEDTDAAGTGWKVNYFGSPGIDREVQYIESKEPNLLPMAPHVESSVSELYCSEKDGGSESSSTGPSLDHQPSDENGKATVYKTECATKTVETLLSPTSTAKSFGRLNLNHKKALKKLSKLLDREADEKASKKRKKSDKKKADLMALSENFKGYHHATWYVSNAKQTASYFVNCFGFEVIAYKGLETKSKSLAAHVVKNGNVVFEFVSPLSPHSKSGNKKENKFLEDIHKFIKKHGDAVKDISFTVTNVDAIYRNAIDQGARRIQKPTTLTDDHGSVRIAIIEVFDDVRHTLIDCKEYSGPFLPGYVAKSASAYIKSNELPIQFEKIDHCVQNEDWNNLDSACDLYSKIFGFHRFWSVDENEVSTEFSALRSIVMASKNEEVKMPINEPAFGICKSQIEEFIDYHSGSGVQHIALLTSNIIQTVSNLKLRGAEFISVPQTYYEKLSIRLEAVGLKLDEHILELQKLGILVDFDEKGYLLQLFTKPLSDRPTFFLEIIQRNNHNGFGAGNFKALFQTIELEQRLRGTLEK